MKARRLPGTFGVGLIYDSFSRSLIFAPFPGICFKVQWPFVGACKVCTHGPKLHRADRTRAMILWRCTADKNGEPCDCKHYDPEIAAGKASGFFARLLDALSSWARNGE